MAHSSLCYLATGLVLPVFPNFILRAARSQQKLVSRYSWLNQRWESTLHASAPANWGECTAVPCTIFGSLLPYLQSRQLCWALAADRQLLDPRTCWVRWEERHHFAVLPPVWPCSLHAKMLAEHRNRSRPAHPSVLPLAKWTHTTMGISKCNF